MGHYNTQNEGVFLAQQAEDAKIAMQRTLADMKGTAMEAADVRWWTQQYPWYAVGAAAVLGFVTTAKVLAPSKPQPPAAPSATASSPWLQTLFGMLGTTLISTATTALHNSINASDQAQGPVDQSQTEAALGTPPGA
jgi:hypothetical protein